ncbi:unnamed protein product [Neisseria lactamica Y92-1009]|nr:unnamed protein product [Neisseria lactamica Y92-1009]
MNMENYFSNLNLDIRTHKLGTFTDQKVTPDVLCAVLGMCCKAIKRNR